MARMRTPTTSTKSVLNADELRSGIRRISRRIEELKQFDVSTVQHDDDPRIKAIEAQISGTINSTFGHDSPEYREYINASQLDLAPISMGHEIPLREFLQSLQRGKDRSIALLEAAQKELAERLEDIGEVVVPDKVGVPTATQTPPPPSLSVIVQGGRLNLADPPPESPFKHNVILENRAEQVAAATQTLVQLVDAVKGDNSVLGEVLRKQLIILLETATQELRAPYPDSGRLKSVALTVKNVLKEAATRAAGNVLTKALEKGADALTNFVDGL